MQVVNFGEADPQELECTEDGETVSFETDEFYVYAIVGAELVTEVTLKNAGGEDVTYLVTIYAPAEARIPEDAEIIVKNIEEDSPEYEKFISELAEGIDQGDVLSNLIFAHLLDISIEKDGSKIQPYNETKVKVTIELKESQELEAYINRINAIHFTDYGVETIEAEADKTDNKLNAISFYTTSFSPFAVAGQMDIGDNENKYPNSLTNDGYFLAAAGADGEEEGEVEPDHNKYLSNTGDGTYKLALNVTGDTTTYDNSNKADIVIVLDESTSMNEYVSDDASISGDDYYFRYYYMSGNPPYYYFRNSAFHERQAGETYDASRGRYNNSVTDYIVEESVLCGKVQIYSDYGSLVSEYRRAVNNAGYRFNNTTRLAVVRNAIEGAVNTLLADGNDVRISVVLFGTGTKTSVTWSTDPDDVMAGIDTNAPADQGTNWGGGLKAARTVLTTAREDADKYVIFLSDGDPSTWTDTDSTVSGSAAVVNSMTGNPLFYSIYAGTGTIANMQTLASSINGNRGTFYDGRSKDDLEDAFSDIIKHVISNLGLSNTSIEDGTTQTVVQTNLETVNLLNIDEDTFRYYRSGGGTEANPKYNPTANTMVVQDGNSTKTVNIGVEWTSSDTPAPPAAELDDDGNVKWDLSSLGLLENGVTYTVTFDCYPSQYTLDLIADLKNGYAEYDDLDDNVKKYLTKNGNDYVLATNTTAKLTYTDTRTTAGEQHTDYTNPDPVSTSAAKQLALSKDWSNILDDRTKPDSLTMHVTRDGADRYEITLNNDNSWSASKWISYGIMTVHNGNVTLKTTGHDYSFSEPSNMTYYWELDVPTIRPMLINATGTLLVLIEDIDDVPATVKTISGANGTVTIPSGNDAGTYYKLTVKEGGDDVVKYYIVDNSVASLKAINNRRSYLNLTKVVDEATAPSDALFTYNVKIEDSNGEPVWFAAQTVEDAAAKRETYQLLEVSDNVSPEDLRTVPNATYNAETKTYTYTYNGKTYTLPAADDGTGGVMYTGFYYVNSNEPFTIKIPAGWNVRFINLPTETTYSITEGAMPEESFTLESITGNRHYKDTDGAEKDENAGTIELNSQKVSGTIEYANSNYTMTFDNKYSTIDVQLKKVGKNGEIIDESVFTLARFKSSAEGRWEDIRTNIKPGGTDETNPVDLGGLGIARYRLTETNTPDGYVKLTDHVYFEVFKEGSELKARLTNKNGDAITPESYPNCELVNGKYVVTVQNTPGTALPNTGGSGTLPYILGGIALIMASALIYGFRLRRRERRYM